jgi:hypothetical protein
LARYRKYGTTLGEGKEIAGDGKSGMLVAPNLGGGPMKNRILGIVSGLLLGFAVPLALPPIAVQAQDTQPVTQPAAKLTFLTVDGASPGHHASVTVQATPNAECSIVYTTPSGRTSKAAGLEPKTADIDGKVSWIWLIGGRTAPGTGHVTVTCNGDSAETDITIQGKE